MSELEIERETVPQDIFERMYSILNEYATSIVDSQGDTIQLKARGGHRWMGSYPNPERVKEGRDKKVKFIDDKDSYPFGVIPSPNNSEDITGFRQVNGEIRVELGLYATKSEHVEKFASKAWAAISNHEDEIKENGFVQRIELEQTQKDTIVRGTNIKVHEKIVPITMELFAVR